MIHARALARIDWRELRSGKHFVHVSCDGAGFIQHEIVMLQHRHTPKRMPLQMDRLVHLVFSIVEGVRDAFRGQNKPNHADERAARKTKQSDI